MVPWDDLLASGWSQCHAERLDWALHAHRAYVGTLGEDLRGSLSESGDDAASAARIAVFGMTRTGKTALILALMGLRADMQKRVACVLGTGAAAGPPDVVIEYRASRDDRWRVGDGSAALDDAQAALRVSSWRVSTQTPGLRRLRIQVPTDALTPDATIHANVRYFELPADDPRDSRLTPAVRADARQLMRAADRVLFVCPIARLTPLKANAEQYPELDMWPWRPNRYLVATTDAMSAQTSLENARARGATLQAGDLRARFVTELRTIDLEFKDAATPDRQIFPLDLDKLGAAATNPADARIAAVMEELFAELRGNLLASGDELQRMRASLEMLGSADVLDKRVRDTHRALRDQERTRSRVASNRRHALERLHQRLVERGNALRASIDAVSYGDGATLEGVQQGLRDTLTQRVHASSWVEPNKRTVSRMQAVVDSFAHELDRHLLALAQSAEDEPDESYWRRVGASTVILQSRRSIASVIAPSMARLRARLAGYWLDDYFAMSNAYGTDLEEFRAARLPAALALADHVAASLWQARCRQLEIDARNLARWQSKALRLDMLVDKQRRETRRARSEGAAAAWLVRRRRKQIRADGRSAKRFNRMMDEAYGGELERRLERIALAAPAAALMELLAAAQLQEEHERLAKLASDA